MQELIGNGGMPNNHLRLGLVDHYGENNSGGYQQLPYKDYPTCSQVMPLTELFLSLRFPSKNLGACLHLLTNSSLLLMTASSFFIIRSFSARHKLHFLSCEVISCQMASKFFFIRFRDIHLIPMSP